MKHKSLLAAAVLAACGLFAGPSLAVPLIPMGTATQVVDAGAQATGMQTIGYRRYIKRNHAYRGRHWTGPGYARYAHRGRYWPRYAGCWNCGRRWYGYRHYYAAPYWAYGAPYYGFDYYPYPSYGYDYPGISLGFGFSFH